MPRTEPVDGVDLTDRGAYPHWARVSLRFSDMDRLGHVNNVAIIGFCETARVEFRESIHDAGASETGRGVVVVWSGATYLRQGYFPGTVEIGTRVLRIGRSSYHLGQGCFQRRTCIATVETVNVWADLVREESEALPQDLRVALGRFTQAAAPT